MTDEFTLGYTAAIKDAYGISAYVTPSVSDAARAVATRTIADYQNAIRALTPPDAEAALRRAVEARIKPLEFKDEHGDGTLTSRETGDLYRVFPQADGGFFAPKLPWGQGSAPDANTLIDRLNRRHTRRILAALGWEDGE